MKGAETEQGIAGRVQLPVPPASCTQIQNEGLFHQVKWRKKFLSWIRVNTVIMYSLVLVLSLDCFVVVDSALPLYSLSNSSACNTTVLCRAEAEMPIIINLICK